MAHARPATGVGTVDVLTVLEPTCSAPQDVFTQVKLSEGTTGGDPVQTVECIRTSHDDLLLQKEVQQRAALLEAIGDLDRVAHDLAVLMGGAARLLSVRPPQMAVAEYRDQAKEGNIVLANEVTSRTLTGDVETQRLAQLTLDMLARITRTVALRAANGEPSARSRRRPV